MLQAFMKWWGRGPDEVPEDLSVDRSLYGVVWQAWAGGFTVSSDMARSNAAHVAIAASLGLITTGEPSGGSFGRTWYATSSGLTYLDAYWSKRATEL
jgi:hypothetical protein